MLTAFCVQHDANHGAYFKQRRLNHLVAWSPDALLGFSSYAWRDKHNVAHHTYTNVDGFDDDATQVPLARFTPNQQPKPWYRFQQYYIWADVHADSAPSRARDRARRLVDGILLHQVLQWRHMLTGEGSTPDSRASPSGLVSQPRPAPAGLAVPSRGGEGCRAECPEVADRLPAQAPVRALVRGAAREPDERAVTYPSLPLRP